MMHPSSDFNPDKFSPDNKDSSILEQDQRELLDHFERIEARINELKNTKEKQSHKAEIKRLLQNLLEIESIWKRSRQSLCQIQQNPYEEMGIVQYRMLVFMEKRKAYRNKLENLQLIQEESVESPNTNNLDTKQEKKAKNNMTKQVPLTTFLDPDKKS